MECAFPFRYDVVLKRLQQTESSWLLCDARGRQERSKRFFLELGLGCRLFVQSRFSAKLSCVAE